ncbi:glycosyltransferase WbsX family protein [Microbacterium profundi]|uniref:glycosyltransferase WbsX family protein n=1 Tax=Microbacterium profundi TaxID=450380 RepID=UPI00068CC8C5|nr:glycoside hydrolase family 99-like domain-containing protein [Microbacterium profundi]
MKQVRTVAFYLPQFHAIPENDRWWGDGFTEWTNVRRAVPAFDDHHHPRQPGELGEYDLRNPEVMSRQIRLAAKGGVDAFCFYYYWFAGKRLLETPLDNHLTGGQDFPFCISWANENWSRRWDGKDHELLIAQEYGPDTATEVFDDFAKYLSDPRYLKVNGGLVLLVHRADHLPDPRQFARVWREEARRRGLGELHLVASETRPNLDPRAIGFDAIAEFPPVGSNTLASVQLTPPRGLKPHFRGRLMSYPRTARRYMRRRNPAFRRHPGVMPGWDNSARRGDKATVYLNSTPAAYARWLQSAREREADQAGEGLVFVNAWNEWAEGAYLEPDGAHGSAYLAATRGDETSMLAEHTPARIGVPRLPWLRSLALAAAASVLNLLRRVQDWQQSSGRP